MIILTAAQLSEIESAAEAAYPAECCGLLVGQDDDDGTVRVSRIVASRNLRADDRNDRFEIDPQVQFDLMRALRGTDERIVGHHHSHPNHPARPSETDASKIFDAELIWIITAVVDGIAKDTAAFHPAPAGTPWPNAFTNCPLSIKPSTSKP